MSSKLTKALEFANYRTTLNVQHNNLKAKVQTLLNYSVNGGTFEISQTLISFVQTLIDQKHTKAVVWGRFEEVQPPDSCCFGKFP